MSSVWVDAVCATCGEPLLPKDKGVVVLPCTFSAKESYASGGNPTKYKPGVDPQIRVMPSKGRKNQQRPEAHHEKCWPGVRSAAGK